ncbi:Rrf2 family transcriptional regulator [Candidatus Curtissbacteria bacterium]|nr:Rrf2 family transcriptional regulator [Candidatus Curtissbacteria bacterium]
MFRLSQKADYGLILLSSVASAMEDRSSPFISVASVANKNQISPKFLSQIAQALKRAGILASREGVSGGYSLAKSANEIKLLDVLKILDGELVEGKCFEEGHECTCGAGEMWVEMKKQMEETIGKKTVADLVATI